MVRRRSFTRSLASGRCYQIVAQSPIFLSQPVGAPFTRPVAVHSLRLQR